MRECTLVQSVNYHLYICEVMSEDSEDLAFLNHVISRDQNISCNHSHDRAAIKIHITTFNRINLHVRCGNLHNFNCFWLSISFFFVLVKAILHCKFLTAYCIV